MKVALLGYGTVANGVIKVCRENSDILGDLDICIALVRDLKKYTFTQKNGVCYSKDGVALTTNLDDIINAKPDIICELMGGTDFADFAIKKILNAKIPLITANKALLAQKKDEIFDLAVENGVFLGYEPSTAGAIPIIKIIKEGLSANKITSIKAILNGTSNYILSLMDSGKDYDLALKNAQDLGYAEANPYLDISGYDAAHKIIILCALAFGVYFTEDKINVRGIENINFKDINFAHRLGKTIKLIAYANYENNELEAWVLPCLIDSKSPLDIGGAKNSILIHSNAAKQSLYSGEGAGGEETASAVISDILDFKKNNYFQKPPKKDIKLKPFKDIQKQFYIRLCVDDKIGIMSKIANLLTANEISIASILQELDGDKANIYISTHLASQNSVDLFLNQLEKDLLLLDIKLESNYMYII